MKLEFVCQGKSVKEKFESIECKEKIQFSAKEIKTSFLCSYEIMTTEEDDYKLLSDLHKQIINSLGDMEYLLTMDEASTYFNQKLYPDINKFERSLRKLYRIVVMRDKNGKLPNNAKDLENADFEKLHFLFFCDLNYIETIRKFCNGQFTEQELKNKIKATKEGSWWKRAFGDEYTFIPNNFEKIKICRNDIMHAHNYFYEDYIKHAKLMEKSNNELNKILNNVLENNIKLPRFTPILLNENLNKILGEIGKIYTIGMGNINEALQSYYPISLSLDKTLHELSSVLYTQPKLDQD